MYGPVYFSLALTIFNLLQACGAAPDLAEPRRRPVENPRTQSEAEPPIDPRLLEAVQVWKEDCTSMSALHCGSFFNRITSIKVVKEFKDEAQAVLGRCTLRGYGVVTVYRDIQILESVLDKPLTLRAVLAHEMGHCAFLKHHVNKDVHLMAPYVMSEKFLEMYLPKLLQEFYTDLQSNNLPSIGVIYDE